MTASKTILIAIVAMTLGGAAMLVIGHYHLSQTIASAAVGVVVGVSLALAAFSFTPKSKRCNQDVVRRVG